MILPFRSSIRNSCRYLQDFRMVWSAVRAARRQAEYQDQRTADRAARRAARVALMTDHELLRFQADPVIRREALRRGLLPEVG